MFIAHTPEGRRRFIGALEAPMLKHSMLDFFSPKLLFLNLEHYII